jgi:glycine/D-amino acid oxidase-like deaminating enzyme
VVVIGGGITGCAAAYFLAREGADTMLLDRAELNMLASGRNAGGVHGQIQHEPFFELGETWARAFAPSLRLMHDSAALWQQLDDELDGRLEVDLCGGLVVALDDAQLDALARKAAIEHEFGNPVVLLSRDELGVRAPYVSDRMAGGLYCAAEGKANPLGAAGALAEAAERDGAVIRRHTDVVGVEVTSGGYRLSTTVGDVECERVVVCAGVESGAVTRLLGIDLPLEPYPIQLAVSAPVPRLVAHLVYFAGGRLTLKQTRRGTVLVGGGWPADEDDETGELRVSTRSLRANVRQAVEVVPALRAVPLVRTWTGVCPGTADHRPLLGEVLPGLVVAVFPFLGFTCGPVMGQLAAELVVGRQPPVDLAPFDPVRRSADVARPGGAPETGV